MKTTPSFVKSLWLLGVSLPALAQTLPSQSSGTAAPQATSKTTTSKAITKKYEGPKVAKSTQKLGQKFIDKSYEDTSPGRVLRVPVKKVAPDQK
jgi:hypothetical protein